MFPAVPRRIMTHHAGSLLLMLSLMGCGRDKQADVSQFVPIDSDTPTVSESVVAGPATPSDAGSADPTDVAPPSLAGGSAAGVREDAQHPPPQIAQVRQERQEPAFRLTPFRRARDEQRAAELGIRRYESRRLVLFTDIDPEIAATLPPLMDQAYDAWTAYFGPLPPDREGNDFQLTGYIMQEKDRFSEAGMLPEAALRSLVHGIHSGYEFWMNEQDYDYYRRHLMFHEGTHCFMTVLPDVRLPLWYLEGMAELFGTHRLHPDGTVEFRVMPDDPRDFVGFGRVEMIRDAIADGDDRSVEGVAQLSLKDFDESKAAPYAWSWAFCKFLDTHPRYSARFRELGRHLQGGEFYRVMRSSFEPDRSVLWVEWRHFAHTLTYGYDIERAAINFERGVPLSGQTPQTVELRSDRGWQPSGVWLEAGVPYALNVEGEIVLADKPRPWISEPQGVSIEYAGGRPIGEVVAAIQSEQPPTADGSGSLLKTFDVGRSTILTPTVPGTLYLRVNDAWNKLADNTGSYHVTIADADDASQPQPDAPARD